MRKWMWASLLTVPLAVGGLVYANAHAKTEKPKPVSATEYVCPITGEELPCPNCCPLNHAKAETRTCMVLVFADPIISAE